MLGVEAVAEMTGRGARLVRRGGRGKVWDPTTTWTILQQDGPDHLGLWTNAIPGRQMALITSGCG